ncbi:hypothetical protein BS47DRAFT_1340813 [Hydnum rufescens UP504]|uniref:Importin N-terminal domain-containing protein n=1 Tax=Hydnum rufescens UP504 TaxID=1448309 RepID=A0A9P6DYY9_9AGAM|nr:hypothetical protein BS47DRAFT_1340813 [Hydnum rufescens UP504]
MDVHSIANLFATSLNPDPNVRKAGEIEIRRIGSHEGVLSALVQIIGNEAVDPAVRQACVVYLKNRVSRAYFVDPAHPRPDAAPIPESDRIFLKQNILPLLVASTTRSIRVQLASCFKTVLSHDFPDNWPGIVDDIMTLLQRGDQRSVYGGCLALLELIRSVRFRVEGNLTHQIAEKTFPALVELGTSIANNMTPDNADCLHLILKTYKASMQTSLSPHQQSPQSIIPWGRLFFQVVNVRLPPGVLLPGDKDDWEKSEWWKAKKWAYNTLNRLFQRYGNPSQLPNSMKKDIKGFSEHFVVSFAPEIFKIYLNQVELYVKKESWLSRKSLSAIIMFFTSCVKPKSTWAILKPHVETLTSTFIFPTLVFDQERADLWSSDPLEYVRRSIEFDDAASPSAAATSCLLQLVQNRRKSTFLPILKFINDVLSSNSATPNEKFGALSMTSALGGVIMRNETVKPQMEEFVMKFVLPEFSSQLGFMRQAACEVIGTLERFGMGWSNQANLEAIYHAVGNGIEDRELPVRVPAMMALVHLIPHDSVRKALVPSVEKIMHILFSLADETDMDAVSEAMETFIESFQAELVPASVQIVERLCQSYVRLIGEYSAAQANSGHDVADNASFIMSPDDDKSMAMMGVTKTIEAVVDAIDTLENPKEVVFHVQELVIPIIILTMERQVIELFDSMFALVDSFTFTLRQISPSMWNVFEQMYKLFKSVAIDYLDEMVPSLDNFIDFGKDTFAQSPEYRRMAIDICITALTNAALGDSDRVNGCALGESILLNLRGHVDDALPSIIAAAAGIFTSPSRSAALRIAILNLLINCVLYNPTLALHIMVDSGNAGNGSSVLARAFFDAWFVALGSEGGKALPRVHDKRLSIVALSALLEMNPVGVPAELRGGWPAIVGGALNVFGEWSRAVERREAMVNAVIEEGDEDDFALEEAVAGSGDIGDDDDKDVWDEDDDYLEMLAEEGVRLRANRTAAAAANPGGTGADPEEESDVSSSEGELEEELDVETALDKVDPYVVFKAALTAFQMNNAPGYQAATTSLSVEQQTVLMEVMRIAQLNEANATAGATIDQS